MKARLSLTSKIALLAVLTLILLTGLLLIFAGVQFQMSPESFVAAPALNRVLSVAGEIAQDLGDTPPSARSDLLRRFANGNNVNFYLVDRAGDTVSSSTSDLPKEVSDDIADRFRARPAPPVRRRSTFRVTSGAPKQYWVAVPIRWRDADSPDIRTAYLVMVSDSFIGNQFFFDPKPWVALTLALTVVFAIVWLPFIRNLTRAVSAMTQVTTRIAEGQFDARLKVNRGDEVGQLASSINRMTMQLSGFVTGQKRFLADVAHELCAPIARTQMALGILEQRADEKTEEYVADVKDDVQHMSELIGELLSFSKAGMQAAETEILRVDVGEIVERVIQRESTPDARIQMSVPKGTTVSANPDCLFKAIANLVRNAIRYAGHAGPISVSAQAQGQETLISVSDSGPGLPEEALDDVFAPFFRLERSRGRDAGGTGLGLAIVKACVEACKGSVRARNRKPSGLEVEIRLRTA